jgi:hypothetical protein
VASWLWTKGALVGQGLFLLTGAFTVGGSLLLVPEAHRGGRFFLSLMAILAAEAATFGWVILVTTGRSQPGRPVPRAGFGKFVLLYVLMVAALVYVSWHQLVNNTVLVLMHAGAGLLLVLAYGLSAAANLRTRAVQADLNRHAGTTADLTRQSGEVLALVAGLTPQAAWAEAVAAARKLDDDLRYAATGDGGAALERELDSGLRDLVRRLQRGPKPADAPELLARIGELRQTVKQRESLVGRSR